MTAAGHAAASLEEQVDQWRSYLRRRQAIRSVDVAELEDHLREQIAGLLAAGLAADEAAAAGIHGRLAESARRLEDAIDAIIGR
jgi:hypothetical protein